MPFCRACSACRLLYFGWSTRSQAACTACPTKLFLHPLLVSKAEHDVVAGRL
jgi:hypothetical protein